MDHLGEVIESLKKECGVKHVLDYTDTFRARSRADELGKNPDVFFVFHNGKDVCYSTGRPPKGKYNTARIQEPSRHTEQSTLMSLFKVEMSREKRPDRQAYAFNV